MAVASKPNEVKTPTPVEAPQPLDASALVLVRNNSDRTLNLSTGQLLAGEEGKATLAEVSMLSDYLVKLG